MHTRKRRLFFINLGILIFAFQFCFAQTSIRELLSFPDPNNLCGSPATGRLAWVFNQKGLHNIFISEDGGVSYRQLTHYANDDGQVIDGLQFSPDGQWLLYFRGGDPGGNWSTEEPVDPNSSPRKTSFDLCSIHLTDGIENVLYSGSSDDQPAISPDSKNVAFVKDGHVLIMPLDNSEKAHPLFFARGKSNSLAWSPDGKKLVFVSSRRSHSFIGVFTDSLTPIKWIDPAYSRDVSPRWSPDSKSVVFVRLSGVGGAPDSIIERHPVPWEIRVAQIDEGKSTIIWESPHTLNGSVPTTDGRFNLHWAANNSIVFLSTVDNWPHLYSVPASGGKPLLLTPGNFMTEFIKLSPDGKQLAFGANSGKDELDIDRRHIGIVSVDKADMKMITQGEGLEVKPVYFGNDKIALISSTPYRPILPAVYTGSPNQFRLIGDDLLSSHYNNKEIVKPRQIIFKAPDGTIIHGQLFEKPGGAPKKPAVVAIHGGPMRQMLLGWNYSGYYAAHYAVNQKLADMGFVVLSVNYRRGIGYGNEFHQPANAGSRGLSEYQDILAAGKWLASQPNVDPEKIGLYGGSYGGYLTACGLGKNSDVFAAGVDISGVHDYMPSEKYTTKFEHAPDAALADTVAWNSSPVSFVDSWTSPVLLINSDDDRNVEFDQTMNLLNRLKRKNVYFESLLLPDDTHDWLRFENYVKIYEATIDFLNRKLKEKK